MMSPLEKQGQENRNFPFTERDRRQLARKRTVRTLDREVVVEVPDETDDETEEAITTSTTPSTEGRQSIRMQAKIAQIGAEMGFRIWIPRNDRVRFVEQIREDVQRIPVTPEKPHSLNYSLTLHNEKGERLVGFDNAQSTGPQASRVNHSAL